MDPLRVVLMPKKSSNVKRRPPKKVPASKAKTTRQRTPRKAAARNADPVVTIDPAIASLLNVKWSEYIPHSPTEKQLAALMLPHVDELLFGGALGGGKSDYLLMEALRYCDIPGFSSIIFRRQLTDLKQPGALIHRSHEWLGQFANKGMCKWVADEHAWIFKCKYSNGAPGPDARLQFGYIGDASVKDRYQSAEYQYVAFDELSQWPDDSDYLFMRSRIRNTVCPTHGKDSDGNPRWHNNCHICDALRQLPLRVRCATNPGAAWIKRRFQIVPDPKQFPDKRQALIAMQEGMKVNFVGIHPQRVFIPSFIDDNPHLDLKAYRVMLKEMSDEDRARLEDGNWEARKDALFKRRWQTFYYLTSSGWTFLDTLGRRDGDLRPFHSLRIFTVTDPAVTVRAGPVDEQVGKKKKSWCVIGVFGVTRDNRLLMLEIRKFRKEIPSVIETLVELNNKWHPSFNKIECNGVGIGVAQYAQLAGLHVQKTYRKADKIENSLSAQILMKNGQILFPETADWLEDVEDVLFGWTGLPTEEDDVVDVISDAAQDITPYVARDISNATQTRSRPIASSTVRSSPMGDNRISHRTRIYSPMVRPSVPNPTAFPV